MQKATLCSSLPAHIADILRQEDCFLVAGHYNPDGDAIGSMAALAHALRHMDKQVLLFNASGIPEHFRWLDMGAPCITRLEDMHDFTPHRLIMLDCADAHRAGQEIQDMLAHVPSINIDHHPGNSEFATINWVAPQYAATGEMLGHIMHELGTPLAGAQGEALYLSLVSDTGSFNFSNTTSQTLELAADILRSGLDLRQTGPKLHSMWSLNRMRLWSLLMGQVRVVHQGRLAALAISDTMLEATGTKLADAEGIIDYMRRIQGVEVAVTVRDDGPSRSKVSLRSNGDINVRRVAADLGGGGHHNAAGVSLDMPLESAMEHIILCMARNLVLDAEGT